jgi:DeoR family transcriptional regulator of aga operon
MLALIREREFMRVSDLSRLFGISEVTVRSDLDALSSDGGLERVHGGAVLRRRRRAAEPSVEESESASAAEKAAIGRFAAAMISSGDTVILDVGSTVAAVARSMVVRDDLEDVVVFTNGLNVALTLEKGVPSFSVVVTGGTLRPRQHSLVGAMSDAILSQINVNTAFIGCNGVHPEEGITNINLPEAMVKRRMIQAAQRCVVVADGSKINNISVAKIIDLSNVDVVITGKSAPPEVVEQLREAGVTVEVAE